MISLANLLDHLQDLPECPDLDAVSFNARRIDLASPAWIARSAESGVAFLFSLPADSSIARPVDLPSIRFRPSCSAIIQTGDSEMKEDVCVVECLLEDADSWAIFVRCIHATVLARGEVSNRSIRQAIDQLLGLFRDFLVASDAEILGLWGEMFFIRHCPDPRNMIRCWRIGHSSRFDFIDDNQRIDVKTTSGQLRVHGLSWQQANPPDGTEAVLTSVKTEMVASGLSVRQLWDELLAIAPDYQDKIDQICVSTLGRDWRSVQDLEFDGHAAAASLELYSARSVPRITELPIGVTNCRFESNFELASPLSEGAFAAGLLQQALACRNSCRG